ncbi:MAG: hypothetical protein AAF502_11665 [Bacteroidota bacterium]
MTTKSNFYYFIALLVVGIFLGYLSVLPKSPESTHTWRQSDCAAIAKNYYRSDLKFFQPRLYNRQEGEGYMVGEFTGTYFLAAVFYKVFGVHDGILRGIHLTIFLFGMLSLMKVAYAFLQDRFLSYFAGLLFFSFPVLAYYGSNFLPDAPAFGFLMAGWASFMRHYQTGDSKSWWWAVGFFTLAGLLKITFLMSVGALGFLWFLEAACKVKIEDRLIFKNPIRSFIGFMVILFFVGMWYVFSIKYNKHHESTYFLNATYPVWSGENMDYFVYTFFRTVFFWSKYYFFPGLAFMFLFLIPYVLIFGKPVLKGFHYGMVLITFAGAIAIWLLWYYQFTDHDYYIIGIYPFFFFLTIGALKMLKENHPATLKNIRIKVILVVFLLINLVYAKYTMNDRYEGKLAYKPNPVLSQPDFKTFLSGIGIHKDTKVISIPDSSPNTTLHQLDLPGFTEWKDTKRNRISVERVQHFIDLGAQFMIVHDPASYDKEYVKSYSDSLAGQFQDVKVYSLSSYFK